MNNRHFLVIIISALLISGTPAVTPASASWSNDPAVNTPVSAATGNQEDQRINRDESGGAIIVWTDYRNSSTTYGDIYVQKLDAEGNAVWPINGVALTAAVSALNPRIYRDGSGGVLITWEHYNGTNYDIYAQKIDSGGSILWTSGGVAVSTASRSQRYPIIRNDGSGGAIIVWQDYRNGTDWNIYIQRINSSGTAVCTANGAPVSTSTGDQTNPRMVENSDNSVIVVWQDYRSGTNWDIYAQKINLNCTMLWTANGIPVVTASGDQYWQRPTADGNGGAIIVWEDYRSGTGVQVYAQRLDSTDGHNLWTLNGVPACYSACALTGTSTRAYPQPSTDGSGGGIVVWQDYRLGTFTHIYAQRIDAGGNILWTTDGIPVSTIEQTHGQWDPDIVTDAYGRSTVVWFDNNGLYAQRINLSGATLWTDGGVAVSSLSSSANNNIFWPALALDKVGYGTIFTWTDYRNGSSNEDIYAQKIQSNGTLPCPNYPVRIQGGSYYATIQSACNAASGQTVQMESIEFTEDLNLSADYAVKLQGGYRGCDFSTPTEFSTIHGSLTISSGTLTADRLIIM